MPKYDNAKLIHEETGREIKQGDTVPNFRGEPTTFLYVSRLPEGNSEGKIMTSRRVGGECYPGVLEARIEIPGAEPEDGEEFTGEPLDAGDGPRPGELAKPWETRVHD